MQTTQAIREEIVFNTRADARRVRRRLRDFSILAALVSREVHIFVPKAHTRESVRALALRLLKERGAS